MIKIKWYVADRGYFLSMKTQMHKKILIILGHPALMRETFCESLARTYNIGAEHAGHEVKFIKIADLSFDPLLHEGYKGNQSLEPDIAAAQDLMLWADHWVIVYPLWQFMMPALLKGFLERTLTKGFAYDFNAVHSGVYKPLKGKTVRLIQTMGMPGFYYRLFYKSHGEKALKNMLEFCGLNVKATFLGMVESLNQEKRAQYLKQAENLGLSAS